MASRAAAAELVLLTCVLLAVTQRADGHTAFYKLARLSPDEAFVEESTDSLGITTIHMSNGDWVLEAKEDKRERVQYSCRLSYSGHSILEFLGKSTIKKVEIGALGLKEIESNCRRRRSVTPRTEGDEGY